MKKVDRAAAVVIKPRRLAQMLDIGETNIYALIKRGDIFAIRVGKSLRIPIVEVDRMLAGVKSQTAD